MDSEISGNLVIDERMESYASFFDHEKATKLSELAKGAKLERAVFKLCTTLKATSNAMRLPWLTVTATENFGRSFAKDYGFAGNLMRLLSEQLQTIMGPFVDQHGSRALRKAIFQLGRKVRSASEIAERSIEARQLWDAYLYLGNAVSKDKENREFHLAVWGSQRIGYGATFHAYEHFLSRCMACATGNNKYRINRQEELIADANIQFSPAVVDQCIKAESVTIARLVRNALAHNDGLVTPQLMPLKHKHGIRVVDDELHIMAPDNQKLMALLQDCAHVIVDDALTRGWAR